MTGSPSPNAALTSPASFTTPARTSRTTKPWMSGNVPVLGSVGIALAAALFGGVFTWYVFRGRLRKVSVTRWLKKRRQPW
jgi:hypothetical protein